MIVVGEMNGVLTVPPMVALIWRVTRWRRGTDPAEGDVVDHGGATVEDGLDQPRHDLVLIVSRPGGLKPALDDPPARTAEPVAVDAQDLEFDVDAKRLDVAAAQCHRRESRRCCSRNRLAVKMDSPSVATGRAAGGNESLGSDDERPTTFFHGRQSRTRPILISPAPGVAVRALDTSTAIEPHQAPP
jgi:hypothetical protein